MHAITNCGTCLSIYFVKACESEIKIYYIIIYIGPSIKLMSVALYKKKKATFAPLDGVWSQLSSCWYTLTHHRHMRITMVFHSPFSMSSFSLHIFHACPLSFLIPLVLLGIFQYDRLFCNEKCPS